MKLEICIDRIDSALAAVSGGADRLEVCSALELGGLTPSYGLVEQCLELGPVEVMMMIRPRAGGFSYAAEEVTTMLRDIRVARQLGVAGVVLGALDNQHRIDGPLCERLIAAARPLSITFHRAFDLVCDPLAAIDSLLELGVDRLLTSGQAPSAVDGRELIRSLVERADNRISIMAGAGVRPETVAELVRTTGVREVHASASVVQVEADRHGTGLVHPTRITRPEIVRAIAQALRACPSPLV